VRGFYRGPVKTDRAPTQHGFEFTAVDASPVVAGIDAASGIGTGGSATLYSAAGSSSGIDLSPTSTFVDGVSQKFVGNGSPLTSVQVNLACFAASGGVVTCEVWAATAGGLPSGVSALATSPDSVNDFSIGGVYSPFGFSFSGFTPANGTSYCVVVIYNDGGSGGTVSVEISSASGDGGVHDIASSTWSESNNLAGLFTGTASGTVVVTADANDNASGFGETAALGTVTVTTTSPDANVNVSGVSATSALGNETVTADANENASGVSATSALGSVAVTANANENSSGLSATSATGTVSVTGNANENASGVAATGAVGNVAPTADANETATGNSAVSVVGSVASHGDANENASGVSATSALGDVTVTTTGGGTQDATVNLTGVAAAAAVGTVAVEVTEGHRSRRLVRFRPIRDTAVKVKSVEAKAEVGYASITADKLYVAPRQETVLVTVDGVEARASSGSARISISCAPQVYGVETRAATSGAEIHGVTYAPVAGVIAHGDAGDARPIGDCAVVANGVYAHGFTMIPSVKAIRNPTDEELMVIIAAAMRQKKNPRSDRRL
jgi:hypothetical protein